MPRDILFIRILHTKGTSSQFYWPRSVFILCLWFTRDNNYNYDGEFIISFMMAIPLKQGSHSSATLLNLTLSTLLNLTLSTLPYQPYLINFALSKFPFTPCNVTSFIQTGHSQNLSISLIPIMQHIWHKIKSNHIISYKNWNYLSGIVVALFW